MPDFAPARLQLVKAIPNGRGWLYEPKFDGYRGLVMRPAQYRISVLSRNGKDLGRFFPELIRLAEALPVGTVLDGEIVHPIEGGVSFTALQHRLMLPLAERSSVAARSPVAFVAFDILATESGDARRLPLAQRRARLERMAARLDNPYLQVVVQTDDLDAARVWLDEGFPMHGIEGVVAKRDEPYPKPNVRKWQKVRRLSTMDVRVYGFTGDIGAPRLVVGTTDPESTQVLGTTFPLDREDAVRLRPLIPRAVPSDRPIWSRFDSNVIDRWVVLPEGLVAEVSYSHLDVDSFRHQARFLRWKLSEPPEPD